MFDGRGPQPGDVHPGGRQAITRGRVTYTADAGARRLVFEGQIKSSRLPCVMCGLVSGRRFGDGRGRWVVGRYAARIVMMGLLLGVGLPGSAAAAPAGRRVSFVFSQTVSGREASGKCEQPTKPNHMHHRCKRTIARGTLTDTTDAGAHQLAFEGQIKNHRLPLGAYTLKITVASATTGARARTQTLRFAIVTAATAETTARVKAGT